MGVQYNELPELKTELGCFPARKLNLRKATIRDRVVRLQARALWNLQNRVLLDMRRAHIPLIVVSSYRSCAEQCRLIEEHGGTCPDGISGIVASVGQSYHNIGLAVDIHQPPLALIDEYRHIMEGNGWHNFSGRNGSDPNHWSYKVVG
jgi:LAS superfamily LD-carboxypeptidase LdcB